MGDPLFPFGQDWRVSWQIDSQCQNGSWAKWGGWYLMQQPDGLVGGGGLLPESWHLSAPGELCYTSLVQGWQVQTLLHTGSPCPLEGKGEGILVSTDQASW